MISLNLTITNPFFRGKFETIYLKVYEPWWKTKCLEIQTMKTDAIFQMSIDAHISGYDHAGPCFSFGVFNREIRIQLYDTRHWDYEKNEWIN